jgi:uncharacterized protein (TIGR03435 family)
MLTFGRVKGVVGVVAVAAMGLSACAQTGAPEAAVGAGAAYEVATIKPNTSGGGNEDSRGDNGRFTAVNCSLKTLIQYDAYGVPGSRIVGGPSWLGTAKFDIQAKMDEATMEQMKTLSQQEYAAQSQMMMQNLLAERFKLAVHWETRELPVYALVVAKGGPKLQATTLTDGSTHATSTNGKLTAKGVSSAKLAQTLTRLASQELGHEVIDRTGLSGRYDFTLNWTPDTGASGANAGADAPDAGPSIFTAVQEQLGLKLESAKGPVQVLVVDHAEMPTEN